MRISVDHMTGFAVGIGVATMGFYVYKKNQSRVDGWLRQQGINVPMAACTDPASLTLEDLVIEKERLEDLIAEREIAAKEAAKG
ncbi:MAG: hypothetical protein CSB34_05850 [Desulfobulbus propionicus]|nr:MAG: hypothetical protein CSB34_05850 [Desulfobulbus propionicus]